MQIGTDDPLCQALLGIINFNEPTQPTLDCLNLLNKLLSNIRSDPYNVKFRKIVHSLPVIQNKVLPFVGVLDFLLLVGFEPVYEMGVVVAHEIDVNSMDCIQRIIHACNLLQSEIVSFKLMDISDPVMNKEVIKRRQEFENQKAIKQKIIDDFNAQRKEIQEKKADEIKRMK